MKDYTLSEDKVAREMATILKYVGTPRGWNAQHFVIHEGELYWEPDAELGKTKWTERQSGIHRITVEGYLLLREAFRLHQTAIHNRDWDSVAFTLEQLHATVFTVFAHCLCTRQNFATMSL